MKCLSCFLSQRVDSGSWRGKSFTKQLDGKVNERIATEKDPLAFNAQHEDNLVKQT
jgi:hypothetical protein